MLFIDEVREIFFSLIRKLSTFAFISLMLSFVGGSSSLSDLRAGLDLREFFGEASGEGEEGGDNMLSTFLENPFFLETA